jgi:uncharacterized protein YjbJ (UPF0337 family)
MFETVSGAKMENQIKGALQDVGGKIQDGVGGLTGDAALQAKGKIRQAAGQIQQSYGEALDTVRETAISNPIATLAAVAGISFALGVLWGRRD